MYSVRLFWWVFVGFLASVAITTTPIIVAAWPALAVMDHYSLVVWCCIVVGIGLFLSWLCAFQISGPLLRIGRIAKRYASGDLSARLYPSRVHELESVAHSLNSMASGLSEKIDSITAERNDLAIVLSSMAEGVIALDQSERVVRINGAACHLLGIQIADPVGKILHEVARNSALHQFVTSALQFGGYHTSELTILGESERTAEISATELKAWDGSANGVLLVFRDITNVRHLERVRRDFVANVSHELRTPITSIKGFVETLLDGAAQDPHDRVRFLKIIAEHADRLDVIFDDLLTLARLEQENGGGDIEKESLPLRYSVVAAHNACIEKAKEKNISISLDCSETLVAQINSSLMEQALINLLDNAVKYTPPGGAVSISVEELRGRTAIRVRDNGVGIEPRHLDRIFERFYRVDQARSRKLGGTGLGLAIVKHIAHAHGGAASVKSVVGEGSVFTIEI